MRKINNYITRYRKYIVILALFMLICYAILYLTYENVKQEMIRNQNARQMIHAKQAAKGIESFFNNHIAALRTMAKNEHVVVLDEYGKRIMQDYYSSYHTELNIITRIDSQGRILYSEPYDQKVIHQIVTKIGDFREVKRTHQIVVSDVFTNRRGFKTIIVHVPVFKRGAFDGTLALLFPFDIIAMRYVEDIRIGQDGYAWVVSKNGIELSCPVPGHAGNSVFDNCRDFPDIIAMAKKMTRGEQGVTTYQYDQIRGEVVSKVTKLAVFMPIRLENNFWSIVVATPEDELLSSLRSFRNRIILIAIFLLIGMGFFFYVLFRTQILVEEVERRRRVEEALRNSEGRLHTLLQTIPDLIWLKDKDGVYLSCNTMFERFFGAREADIVGKTDYDFVDRELADSFGEHDRKAIAAGKPTSNEEWITFADDGHRAFLDTVKTPMYDARGTLIGVLGIGRDITERKRAEEALQESEERFRRLLQNVPEIAIQGYRLDGITTYWNQASERLYGYTEQEAIGQNLLSLIIPPEMQREVHNSMQQMIETGKPISSAELSLMRNLIRKERGWPSSFWRPIFAIAGVM